MFRGLVAIVMCLMALGLVFLQARLGRARQDRIKREQLYRALGSSDPTKVSWAIGQLVELGVRKRGKT